MGTWPCAWLGGVQQVLVRAIFSPQLQPWGLWGGRGGQGLGKGLSWGCWPSPHCSPLTGPLPAPLLVVCPSQAELGRWLYHLEKQMALLRGLQRCHSAPPQVSTVHPNPLSQPPACLP